MGSVGRTLAAATAVGCLIGPGRGTAQETPATHEVRRGDTLWDLAARYLGDPFRWPDLHRLNTTVVEDPHWIYPGEVLRLPGTVVPAPGRAAPPPDRTGAPPRGGSFDAPSLFDQNPGGGATRASVSFVPQTRSPVVSFSDHYRVGFLASPGEIAPEGRTARKLEENPLGLDLPPAVRVHDRVVLDLPAGSGAPGETWQAIRWGRGLGGHGRVAHSMALLRLTGVEGDTARAVVTHLYGPYQVGDPVIPATPFEPRPDVIPETVQRGMAARVVGFEIDQPLVGLGEIVFLDVGGDAGTGLGDEFAVFPADGPDGSVARADDAVGVVRVLRARPRSSTARVVSLRDAGVSVGSPARLIRRMPPPE